MEWSEWSPWPPGNTERQEDSPHRPHPLVPPTHLAQLNQVGQHDDGGRVLFPHHMPEVYHSLFQRTLGRDVLPCPLEALHVHTLRQSEL